jgi:2-polyprenyl-6-methoxyphenol hydroxylase-like FAD-dependent oxidoreductase
MFEAFGFADRVAKEAYWVNETTFWRPDDRDRTKIVRASRIQDVEDGLSEFPHVILNQARVHDFYLEVMSNSPSRLTPHYSRKLVDLKIANNASDHPVTARFERQDSGREGEIETVKTRYVVGCDGARSAVRASLGRALHGDSAQQAWGVMDVLAVIDFPDVRFKSAIQSASEGNALIIPREGGYLFRIYIELDKLAENERVASLKITSDHLAAAAQRILRPYTLAVKEIVWWSVYEIGQRLTDKFDDAEASEGKTPRVFIAGDACHTHSPKAGQGMNVSMQDAFNLGWKLAAVLLGRIGPTILKSYSDERHAIAQELIDFDRKWAKMFSAPPKDASRSDAEGVDPKEFQGYFMKQARFTAGTATCYPPSILTGEATHQNLATGFAIGMRFHSAPVVRLADAKPVHLGHVVKADGRFRLFAFADHENPASASSRLRAWCDYLERSPQSPVRTHTAAGADIDSAIDLRAVFQQGHRELDIAAMPALLLPAKGRFGLIDYEKMFCPDPKARADIFDMRGVDRKSGCVVIVRPDQYVAHVLPLDGYAELEAYFGGFMLTAGSATIRR